MVVVYGSCLRVLDLNNNEEKVGDYPTSVSLREMMTPSLSESHVQWNFWSVSV